ncbi:16S rRNA (cytidine(1402)-2'-O)-methyltransferase [Labilibacter sediminis]|nr:16S rRNA (cytidine(1402)-2'-O)-methyltransferase [Labilibacter sediminis]
MGKLFLVPTPIGNLEDITLRALTTLKEVDFILAEDTRKTGFLLKHFQIDSKMFSHHKFNEHKTSEMIVQRILAGETCALVSDAGTPAISDPGYLLVKHAVAEGVEVECLPGATAFVPALVNSGLPNDRFCFEGFLPQKKGRQKRLQALAEESRTMIFYESPFRLVKTLKQLAEVLGNDRQTSVSRELTKLHEETKRGTLLEVASYFEQKTVKGEIVIIVEGTEDKPATKKENKYSKPKDI